MTLKDSNTKKVISDRLVSSHHLSSNNEANKTDHVLHHSNNKIKQIRKSLLNLLHFHRTIEDTNKKTANQQLEEQQQEMSTPTRSSIIKPDDFPRSLSKKSVAFASSVEPECEENKENDIGFNFENPLNQDGESEVDIVTVIANKRIDDDILMNANAKNQEPYPFRSEVDLSAISRAQAMHKNNSKNKIIDRLAHSRSPKRTIQALPTIKSVSIINRTASAPDMLTPSSRSLPQTAKAKTNDKRKPLKNLRTWFKSLSIRQLIRRKRKDQKQTKRSKTKNPTANSGSKGLRRFSELLF